MSTPKKASVKAIQFCNQYGATLQASATWETCANRLLDQGFLWEVGTGKEGTTIVKLYREESKGPDSLLETWEIPSATNVFSPKDGDWDWPFLYRLITEYLVANLKKILAHKKPAPSKNPYALSNPDRIHWATSTPDTRTRKTNQIKVEEGTKKNSIQDLREAIKASQGARKKQLIQEYNKRIKEAERSYQTANSELQRNLRARKVALYHRARYWEKQGRPESDIQAIRHEMSQIQARLDELSVMKMVPRSERSWTTLPRSERSWTTLPRSQKEIY